MWMALSRAWSTELRSRPATTGWQMELLACDIIIYIDAEYIFFFSMNYELNNS